MSKEVKKGFKEAFSNFFESPSRSTLKTLLKDNTGEYNDLDFKRELPEKEVDMVKHILAMANTSGGVIVYGVEEDKKSTLIPVGINLKESDDKTKFRQKLDKYLDRHLKYEVIDFHYPDTDTDYQEAIQGKTFRVIIVEYNPRYIPFLSKKQSEKLERKYVYVRKNYSSEIADYESLQNIFSRRIETEFSSLREITLTEHLSELKEMYPFIEKGTWYNDYEYDRRHIDIDAVMYGVTRVFEPNPNYPKEDFEKFVGRMIDMKKSVIESLVKSRKYE